MRKCGSITNDSSTKLRKLNVFFWRNHKSIIYSTTQHHIVNGNMMCVDNDILNAGIFALNESFISLWQGKHANNKSHKSLNPGALTTPNHGSIFSDSNNINAAAGTTPAKTATVLFFWWAIIFSLANRRIER